MICRFWVVVAWNVMDWRHCVSRISHFPMIVCCPYLMSNWICLAVLRWLLSHLWFAGAEKVVGWALSYFLMQSPQSESDARLVLSAERYLIIVTFWFVTLDWLLFVDLNGSWQPQVRDWCTTVYPEWIQKLKKVSKGM